jgi:hypothetical protein
MRPVRLPAGDKILVSAHTFGVGARTARSRTPTTTTAREDAAMTLMLDLHLPHLDFSAVSCEHRRCRYLLTPRRDDGPAAEFVGLNPSKSNKHRSDGAARRCIGFARPADTARQHPTVGAYPDDADVDARWMRLLADTTNLDNSESGSAAPFYRPSAVGRGSGWSA